MNTDRLARFDARGHLAVTGPAGRLAALHQQSPIRYLRPVPDPGDPPTAILVNTAGGVVGGDRLDQRIDAGDRAALLVTGQAAEKIYRSDGSAATVTTSLACTGGAGMEFLPQGTILFDGGRLVRRTTLSVDAASSMLFGEILHFGRRAMGERFRRGLIDDRIMLYRSGRLVLADAFRLDGERMAAMTAPSGLGGADTCALLLLEAPGAATRLGGLRAVMARDPVPHVRSAAAAFADGPLVARWIGHDAAALRQAFGTAWRFLRTEALGHPARLPRIWSG